MPIVLPDDPTPVADLDDGEPFPQPEAIRKDGLAAIGGDLSPARLLAAYRLGFFPWCDPDDPLLWWSPDPRLIIDPGRLHVSRSLRATIRKQTYTITFDRAFLDVLRACALTPRRHEEGTWITSDVAHGYHTLHQQAYAHSVEAWHEGRLVGGLYGVYLGRCFFGESMFSTRTDASKVALVALAERLSERGVGLIDGQVSSPHLLSLGGQTIPRLDFLERLNAALAYPDDRSTWNESEAV